MMMWKKYVLWMGLMVWANHYGEGLDLLNKSISTRTDVTNQASLSLDIQDMKVACQQKDVAEALNIYMNGKHSPIVDRLGRDIGGKKRSFDTLFTDSRSSSEPTFQSMAWIWHLLGQTSSSNRLSLKDYDKLEDALQEHAATSSILVRNMFANAANNQNDVDQCLLAVEATIATQLFLQASHELWDGVWDCSKSSSDNYNPDADTLHDNDGGVLAIDEFIAYWVGLGDASDHALYELSRQAAVDFATLDPLIPNSSRVHTKIREYYEEASGVALTQPDACTPNNLHTVPHLWKLANLIQTQMYIPLLQRLFQALANQDTARIKLYAQAVIPQFVQCYNYDTLQQNFLDNTPISDLQSRITDLQSFLPCLGITCADIGSITNNSTILSLSCIEDDIAPSKLASYTPRTNVLQQSKLDLDLYQMHLFMRMGFSTLTWDFAEYVYRYGKNSIKEQTEEGMVELRSFQMLATSSHRKLAVPYYELFETYYNDPDYADTIIMQTFTGSNEGKWAHAPKIAKQKIICITIQAQIMFMQVLSELADSVQDCKAGDANKNDNEANAWDEVAAYLIGYLENVSVGNYGMFHWSLTRERSTQFLVPSSVEDPNDELTTLLYAGQAQIRQYDCKSLQLTVDMIMSVMLVPLYQSILYYADINQNIGAFDSNAGGGNADYHIDEDVAAGEAYAYALLPALAAASVQSSQKVQSNMITIRGIQPVKDKAQGVADALAVTLNHYKLTCVKIGIRNEIDICSKYVPPSSFPSTSASSTFRHHGYFIILFWSILCLYYSLF